MAADMNTYRSGEEPQIGDIVAYRPTSRYRARVVELDSDGDVYKIVWITSNSKNPEGPRPCLATAQQFFLIQASEDDPHHV